MEKMKKRRETEEFIMSPTVDICFKELMQNPKVRKGMVAAILGKDPDEIESTVLMPTILQQEYADDNICFRAISFCEEGTGKIYTDKMKIYVLELPKLPPEQKNEKDIIRWMRFLRAKSRKEFEKMAERDEYIQEAYEALKRMSADEKKRLEYEAREKALRDYNTQMYSAEKRGIEAGMKIGEKRMLEQAKRTVQVLKEMGMPMEQIVQAVGREENEVKSWLEEK